MDKANDASKATNVVDKVSDTSKLFNPPKLNRLSPKEIVDLNIQELKGRLPEGWTFHENNGRVHIKENGKPVDIHGNNVDVKSPAGHIPWDKW